MNQTPPELEAFLRDTFAQGTLEEFAAALALVHFAAIPENYEADHDLPRPVGSALQDEIKN